jgi:cytochrome b pre-mRNA-processing protein 3
MTKNLKQINPQENKLYNKILLLSRNKLFYTKLALADTFQNRINLIFIHISFLFIKMKENRENELYKKLYQKAFDLMFERIELNMRELGYGDVGVNKNMKFLVKNFYNILLNCEDYINKNDHSKNSFFLKNLEIKKLNNSDNNNGLIDYFNKFYSFCFDLPQDSVLKGEFNFNYKK